MLVVGAAIVRDGRVLAARRRRPERLAGGWEFPGGKVEDGEDEATALARECHEELSVAIDVVQRVGGASDGELTLVLYTADIAAGEPTAGADHDELRWLTPAEFDDVDWLPIDRDLLAPLRALLQG